MKRSTVVKVGGNPIRVIGDDSPLWGDVFHDLLRTPWRYLYLGGLAVYLGICALFTPLYLMFPGSVEGARPGDVLDHFSFSVQTLSTIGYGGMSPGNDAGEVIMIAESFVGLVGVAMLTGLFFSKFARPTSKVFFADCAVVHQWDGERMFMVRVANGRQGEIISADFQLTVLLRHVTKEGHRMRKFHDMKLTRAHSPMVSMSWMVMHPIDEDSPIHGWTAEDLRKADAMFIALISGFDDVTGQPVLARKFYRAEDIRFDEVYQDVFIEANDGERQLRLDRISATRPDFDDGEPVA